MPNSRVTSLEEKVVEDAFECLANALGMPARDIRMAAAKDSSLRSMLLDLREGSAPGSARKAEERPPAPQVARTAMERELKRVRAEMAQHMVDRDVLPTGVNELIAEVGTENHGKGTHPRIKFKSDYDIVRILANALGINVEQGTINEFSALRERVSEKLNSLLAP